jgi:hypothetical protein
MQRWITAWVNPDGQPRTPIELVNEDIPFDPPNDCWVRFMTDTRPGGPGTIGRRGNRKMDRAGVVYIDLREPPGKGVGSLADLASEARDVFEGCRFDPHDIRFGVGDIGPGALIENGRWWGVTIELRFDYEEIK